MWDLEYDLIDNVLVAGTLGRGAWTLNMQGSCGFANDVIIANTTINASRSDSACHTLTAGPNVQINGASTLVQFTAGRSITLENGFSVSDGARLIVDIDTYLDIP